MTPDERLAALDRRADALDDLLAKLMDRVDSLERTRAEGRGEGVNAN